MVRNLNGKLCPCCIDCPGRVFTCRTVTGHYFWGVQINDEWLRYADLKSHNLKQIAVPDSAKQDYSEQHGPHEKTLQQKKRAAFDEYVVERGKRARKQGERDENGSLSYD